MAQPQHQAGQGAKAKVSGETHIKTLAACVKAASAPTEQQLAAIGKYTLRAFTADELMVRTFVLAHNGIDRDNECFDEALLGDFATTIVGKGSYIKHPTSWQGDGGPAEGRVFGARVETMSFDEARALLRAPNLKFPPDRSQAQVLMTDAYYARTPDNQSLLTKLDAGIAGDVSIGFSASTRTQLKDAEGRPLDVWRLNAPGEAVEQSLVWLGAQPGARAVKSATHSSQETVMNLTPEQIAALQNENATLKTAQAEGTKAVDKLKAIAQALGEKGAELLDAPAAPAALAALVTDGKKYHDSLVEDIVTLERHLKITGDTDEAKKSAEDLYGAMPVDKLVNVRKALEARAPNAQIKTGDPNSGAPGGFKQSAGDKETKSPLDNPALAA